MGSADLGVGNCECQKRQQGRGAGRWRAQGGEGVGEDKEAKRLFFGVIKTVQCPINNNYLRPKNIRGNLAKSLVLESGGCGGHFYYKIQDKNGPKAPLD